MGNCEPLQAVSDVDLPSTVADLADAYDRQFEDRDRFVWQWIYALLPEFTLSSVSCEHARHVRTQKTILTMYVTVLDDCLETHGDRATVDEARRIHRSGCEPDPTRSDVDSETLAFLDRVWATFEDGLDGAPRRTEFADVFEYDLGQSINAIEYSATISDTPQIANLTGARRYDSHNMVMFPFADVDLMFSPTFDLADFGPLRDLLWSLQEQARIGNWITTWERELAEGDYSSGVVVTALQDGVVTPGELASADDHSRIVGRIRTQGIEERFRRQWAQINQAVERKAFEADSVDLDALVEGMETVLAFQLASQGLK